MGLVQGLRGEQGLALCIYDHNEIIMFSIDNNAEVDQREKTEPVCGKYLLYPCGKEARIAEGGLRKKNLTRNNDKSDEPLVSIITVCYNAAKTIDQCIASVLRQTYKNIEYIVIDGGSSDNTVGILEKYNNKIDYYISEPDDGLYEAMNKGLALASGEYVLMLNSDDWYANNCVELLVRANNYSGANIVSALAMYVDESGTEKYVLKHMPFDESVFLGMPLRHELMLIPSRVYNNIGNYNEEYKVISDLDLAIRIYRSGFTVYEIQKPLLYFRISGVSNTNIDKLIQERSDIIKNEFPFMDDSDVNSLSLPRNINAEVIASILDRYEDPLLARALFYYARRRRFDTSFMKLESMRSSSPAVSVVIAIYNAESTLARCLDSVLGQSLRDIEVICVNDSTPDRSQDVIDSYARKDDRIVSVTNPENRGLGPTRNVGVRHARGAYVFHVDPDDVIPDGALMALYEAAIEYGSDIVKGSYIRYGRYGDGASMTTPRPISDMLPLVNTDVNETNELLRTTEGHWSCLYSASIARNVSYPEDLKMGQDSLYLVKAMLSASYVTVIDKVVYHYIHNPESTMNNFNFRKYTDALEWRRRSWYLLNDYGLSHIGNRLMQSYWGDSLFLNIRKLLDEDEMELFFSEFRRVFEEIGIPSTNRNTTSFLRSLFPLIIKNKKKKVYKLIDKHSRKS